VHRLAERLFDVLCVAVAISFVIVWRYGFTILAVLGGVGAGALTAHGRYGFLHGGLWAGVWIYAAELLAWTGVAADQARDNRRHNARRPTNQHRSVETAPLLAVVWIITALFAGCWLALNALR